MLALGTPHRPSVVRRSRPRLPVLVAAILLALFGWRFGNKLPQAPQPPRASESVHVVRVIDGDTLLLEHGVRVRLLGVNTPEIAHDDQPGEPLGAEATEFTRRFIEGKSITLEYDRERVDNYGRTLAYVYADQRMLNEALIEAGYSEAVTRHPYRSDRKKLFEAAEHRAHADRLGIWSQPGRTPR